MNLFNFTFHLQTSSLNEVIVCMVYGRDFSEACERVIEIGLPIRATCEKDLKESIREVVQVTDNEEAEV